MAMMTTGADPGRLEALAAMLRSGDRNQVALARESKECHKLGRLMSDEVLAQKLDERADELRRRRYLGIRTRSSTRKDDDDGRDD